MWLVALAGLQFGHRSGDSNGIRYAKGAIVPHAPSDREVRPVSIAGASGSTALHRRAYETCTRCYRWRGALVQRYRRHNRCLCGKSFSNPPTIQDRQAEASADVLVCRALVVDHPHSIPAHEAPSERELTPTGAPLRRERSAARGHPRHPGVGL
jgi:hypothetical protein